MIKDALAAYANSRAFQKVFVMDRSRTIGASEIGRCARETYFRKTEGRMDSDHADSWGARLRGTVMEDRFWQPAMQKRFGKSLLFSGSKQTTFADKYLSATPDGLVVNQKRDILKDLGVEDIGPSKCFVIECKTIDPRVNLYEAKQENVIQTHVQLGLIREFTIYKPDFAVISYTDASFWDDVDEFVVKFDQEIYDRMHARAVKIKTATSPDQLPPEGWIAGGKDCEHCAFTRTCGIIRRSVPEVEAAADPQFKAEITDLCMQHAEIDQAIKKATIQLNTLKQEIKDRLRAKSVRKIPGVVSWSPVKGRDSYDMKGIREAAEKAGIDLAPYCTTGDPTDQLRVTVGPPPRP